MFTVLNPIELHQQFMSTAANAKRYNIVIKL